MRTNLAVPFSEKDEAKRLGARWDAAKKLWYVDKVPDLTPFARWLAGENAPSVGKPSPARPRPTPATAETRTGPNYLALPCDCLPWIGCEQCQPALDAKGWGSKR